MRKIVIADITDLMQCADGEHYYCKYQVMDNLEFINEHLYDFDHLGVYSHDELLFKPSREYAIEMVKKDNGGKLVDYQVEDLMEYGTSRFRYLHDIKKSLEEQFPDHEIIISKNGNVSEFWDSYLHEEYRMAFNDLPSKDKEEIFKEIMEDPSFYDRYADWAKYDAMFVYCYRKHKHPQLAQLIKEHNKKD